MKKLLFPILASLMLAAPCLNAGLADWISDNLPKSWQLSKEYRDEIKHMQEKTGVTSPVICVKMNSDIATAGTFNIGAGPLRCAIMLFSENYMNNRSPKSLNTATIAHELTHVEHNHGWKKNTLGLAFVGSILTMSAQLIKWCGQSFAASAQNETPKTFRSFLKSAQIPAVVAIGAFCMLAIHNATDHTSTITQQETQAEEGSFKKLQQLGYSKATQELHQYYRGRSKVFPKDMRIKGEHYPTLEEYIAWSGKTCKECGVGINPAERPDSPNLMRNGPAQPASWYETIFGKKS
jgi:hypothetical protein